MPRKRQTPHAYYGVTISSYASAEIKEMVRRGEIALHEGDNLRIESVKSDWMTEGQVAPIFLRAVKKATADPLSIRVTIWRNGARWMEVHIAHPRN